MIRRFLIDRRGTSLVTYTLVLPIMLLLVFGTATMWRIISIRHSVDLATYEAARYLSRQGRYLVQPPGSSERWAEAAYERVYGFIDAQIRRNPFVAGDDTVEVEIIPPVGVDCPTVPPGTPNHLRVPEEIRFTVITTLTVRAPLRTPFLPSFSLTLREAYDDVVECPRAFMVSPPPEGDTY